MHFLQKPSLYAVVEGTEEVDIKHCAYEMCGRINELFLEASHIFSSKLFLRQ